MCEREREREKSFGIILFVKPSQMKLRERKRDREERERERESQREKRERENICQAPMLRKKSFLHLCNFLSPFSAQLDSFLLSFFNYPEINPGTFWYELMREWSSVWEMQLRWNFE